MELFSPKHMNFNWTKHILTAAAVSLLVTIAGVVLFFKPGPNYGIDFKGGVQLEVVFNDSTVTDGALKDLFSTNASLQNTSVQSSSAADNKKSFLITANAEDQKAVPGLILDSIKTKHSQDTFQVTKTSTVGPRIGQELKQAALLSLLYTFLLIGIYLYWRFDIRFIPGALACVLHDITATIGFIVLLGLEFDSTIVAALLTLAGYSINDTVVIFDRIRELEAKLLGKSKEAVVNEAINSCLGRTIITSITAMTSCVIIYFFAGESLKPFALALFFGIFVGTYSSVYVATPLYLKFDEWFQGKRSLAKQAG